MPKKKSARRTPARKKTANSSSGERSSPKRPRVKAAAATTSQGPVTLAQAETIARGQTLLRTVRKSVAPAEAAANHASVAKERKKLDDQIRDENKRRIREYRAVMTIMCRRGVKGMANVAAAATTAQPLRIFAEGDSWFDYPAFLSGGIIPRLKRLLGLPILSLAKAGDEVRQMLGVEERKLIAEQFRKGLTGAGPWDVLLFSGGGNDIVGNPMALWVQDFDASVPPANLLSKGRFNAALDLVLAGYEDLIAMRDLLSPNTHLVFHGYDFAIPDGRGVCGFGPWMKPTFDLRGFPGLPPAVAVVNSMLQQFAARLQALAVAHNDVTFINTQGVLAAVPGSWHNELHPTNDGFKKFAAIFEANLKTIFPGRFPA